MISTPPTQNKYITLKTQLTNTFGLSKRERATRLLHFQQLGDSKPSILMDEILALLRNPTPCLLFNQLFLERLPEDIRIQLVNDLKLTDYRVLAKRADSLWVCRDTGLDIIDDIHLPARNSPSRRAKYPLPRSSAITIALVDKLQDSVASSSKRHFLVDTEAEVSVLPATGLDTCMRQKGLPLAAANGNIINTYGTRTLSLHFSSNTYKQKILTADVTRPLQGADFLRAHSLLVNLRGKWQTQPHIILFHSVQATFPLYISVP